jgi:small-conductance mechanosensitive channel
MSTRLSRLLTPTANQAGWLLFMVISLLLLAGYLGYQAQIKAVLDQPALSAKIGRFRLSPYIFIKSLLTLFVVFWTAGLINNFISRQLLAFKGMRSSSRTLIAKFLSIIIYILCGLVSLRVIGIDLTALAVFGGAIGIGLGFGLQKITSNFISGLILLFEKSLQVDDLIELADGTQGYVRFMGARYTLVEAFDGKEIMVPNEDFITARLTNLTYNSNKAQIEVRVGVSYRSDLSIAQQAMMDAANEHPRCLRDPEPRCYLNDFGDNAVIFLLHFWVEDVTEGRFSPKSDVMFAIWRKFNERGIELAYPQRDIHIKSGWPIAPTTKE